MTQNDNNLDLTHNCACIEGFVAGTLVHAQDANGNPALVPIEQLKVGDMVLTRYTPEGELTYKPITATNSTPNTQIFMVQMRPKWAAGNTITKLLKQGYTEEEIERGKKQYENILCTQHHPFWVNETQSWTPLDNIWQNDTVTTFDNVAHYTIGGGGYNKRAMALLRHKNPSLGYFSNFWLGNSPFDADCYTDCVDLRTFESVQEQNPEMYKLICNKGDWRRGNEVDVNWGEGFKDAYIYRTVYGITVADTHSYFVGKGGYWVHNE